MINLAIDHLTGDIQISKRNVTVATDTDALSQLCESRLLMFKNDYFLDKTQGIPYISQVFVKTSDKSLVDSFFKSVLLDTPDVNSLISFVGDYDGRTRTYHIKFEVDTSIGTISGGVEVEVF